MAKTAILVPRQEMQLMAEQLIGQYQNLTPLCIEYIQKRVAAIRAAELEEQGCDLIV